MADYELIKNVKDIDLNEVNKPKIDYADFEVIVEGKKVLIGIPNREADRFFGMLEENVFFTRRKFRALMREFRGVRK